MLGECFEIAFGLGEFTFPTKFSHEFREFTRTVPSHGQTFVLSLAPSARTGVVSFVVN
jgi:hypothetical protein